jgi:uncharacterized membrane protein
MPTCPHCRARHAARAISPRCRAATPITTSRHCYAIDIISYYVIIDIAITLIISHVENTLTAFTYTILRLLLSIIITLLLIDYDIFIIDIAIFSFHYDTLRHY